MSYTLASTFAAPAGLTLKAALTSAGTVHATQRDLSVVEIGQKFYEWATATMPDSYRGSVVFYTGTLGAGSDFTGVVVYAAASINPQEVEFSDAKTSAIASAPSAATIAAAVLAATTAAGLSLDDVMSDLAKLQGNVVGVPLVVTATSRTAGSISQTIGEASGTVTVTRTA